MAKERLVGDEGGKVSGAQAAEQGADVSSEKDVDGHESSIMRPGSDSTAENGSQKEELPASEETKVHRVQLWTEIRPSLCIIEDMMSIRVKKKTVSVKDERNKKGVSKDEQIIGVGKSPSHTDDSRSAKGACEEESDEEFYDVERSDPSPDGPLVDGTTSASPNGIAADAATLEATFPWKEELEVLVRGGVPMALRGEVLHFFLTCEVYLFLVSYPLVCSCALALASVCGCESKAGGEVLSGFASLRE